MMSSCTLVHTCLRAEVCSCGFKFNPFSAFSKEEDGRETKRRRRIQSELPEDLRLPVKSLTRFKCVCRFWYDLIRSPKFMALHDTNKMNQKRMSLYCHSYSRDDGGKRRSTISVRLFDDAAPMYLTIPVTVEHVKLVGCCNGLVCLSLWRWHHRFLLWNPATTKYRLIFETNPSRPKDARIYSGFCFDSIANTYKLVRATFFPCKESLFMITVPEGSVYVILHVFTLNDNSWREKKLLAPCRFDDGGFMSVLIYVGRCMYWTVSGGSIVPDKYILCLDMVDELFKVIELPCLDHLLYGTRILDYKGSLAIFVWNKSVSNLLGHRFDMWVLNDCGGSSDPSWCKQLTLTPSVAHVEYPLGFFSKGDSDVVVLSTPYQCLFWDRDSGETTKVILENGYIYPFFPYSESFASVY